MAKSPLHDNPRSSKGEKPKEEAAPEKAAEKPAEGDGGAAAPAAEAKAAPAEEKAASPKDMFLDGMKAIRKRHESEMRDHHGNHRESMRQMASRHTKEIADHFDMHGAGEAKADEGAGAPAEGGGEA
jgi:hypothetical protein